MSSALAAGPATARHRQGGQQDDAQSVDHGVLPFFVGAELRGRCGIVSGALGRGQPRDEAPSRPQLFRLRREPFGYRRRPRRVPTGEGGSDGYDDVAPPPCVRSRHGAGDAGVASGARRRAVGVAQEFRAADLRQLCGQLGQKGIQLDSASAVRRYFTPGLASLILEDGAAAHARGEPPSLDGDAFVGKQDWDIADLSVDVKESGARATAVVSFTDAGKAGKVVVELLKVGESWRIADIQWDSGTLRGLYRKK